MTHPSSNSRPPAGDPEPVRTLVDALIEEQRTLGAVEQFARWHDRQPHARSTPALEPHYRRLLPVSRPVAGQQLAFDVDLDACSGCKACVTACHALNGLEEDESWRSVGLLVSRQLTRKWADRKPMPAPPPVSFRSFQHITTACHHCLEPACAHGCPVLAYDKDPITGIVRHLDDQCIGCSYCQMTCPYEVPRYSQRLGIVRKCDLCQGRLAEGEAPACVQSCPNEAIRIAVVDTAEIRDRYRTPATGDATLEDRPLPAAAHCLPGAGAPSAQGRVPDPFLPDSPLPHLTLPTTRYHTTRQDLATLVAADSLDARPAAPHTPLALMLVLTQFATGGFLAECLARRHGTPWPLWASALSLLALLAGLGASSAHLGQPLRAWRAFLGWRRSWLSREILVLSAFAGLASTHLSLLLLVGPRFAFAGACAAALAGLAGVYTSVRVYSCTGREFWSFGSTAIRFFGSVALATAGVSFALDAPAQVDWLPLSTVVILRLAHEAVLLRHHRPKSSPALNRTARLLLGPLAGLTLARLMLAGTGMLAAIAAFSLDLPVPVAAASALAFLAAEWVERSLFFRAVAPLRMPGQPA